MAPVMESIPSAMTNYFPSTNANVLDCLWNLPFCAGWRRRFRVDFRLLSRKGPATTGADDAPRPHCPSQPIRYLRQTRDRLRAEESVSVAGRASDAHRPGRSRPAARRSAGDRAAGPAGRGGAPLRAPQTASPAELRGTGLPPRGLRLVPGLRPAALGL